MCQCRDFRAWVAVAVVFLYLLLPFDILPDVIPIFGIIDDVVLLVGLFVFLVLYLRR